MIQSLPTQTKCVDLKRQGLAKVEHKPPICEEDLKKLYESTAFGLDDPEKLQNKVFFEVMLYFCRRGRQNLRQLKKTNFSFNTDSTGARYVCKATNELTKKGREDGEGFDGGFMYEKPGPNCPVVSFELYLSHLNPLNEFLFQRPKRNVPLLMMFGTTTWWSENVHLARKCKTYREKQNSPNVTQTIQSGRQMSQSLTSQVLKQGTGP